MLFGGFVFSCNIIKILFLKELTFQSTIKIMNMKRKCHNAIQYRIKDDGPADPHIPQLYSQPTLDPYVTNI